MVQKEVLESLIITGQPNFENLNVLNPIGIKMENNQILVILKNIKNYLSFLPTEVLFSGGIENNKNQTFIVCIGLSIVRDSLINGKPYQILGLLNLGCV